MLLRSLSRIGTFQIFFLTRRKVESSFARCGWNDVSIKFQIDFQDLFIRFKTYLLRYIILFLAPKCLKFTAWGFWVAKLKSQVEMINFWKFKKIQSPNNRTKKTTLEKIPTTTLVSILTFKKKWFVIDCVTWIWSAAKNKNLFTLSVAIRRCLLFLSSYVLKFQRPRWT